MLVLNHLLTKLRFLLTFAYGIQGGHALVRWNPLPIANKNVLDFSNINQNICMLNAESDSFSTIYLTGQSYGRR